MAMIFSYTQISNYLRCPRSYRLRYLEGWQEKEIRAGMVFGRSFERALSALFCGEDPQARLFTEWAIYREASFVYKSGESWDRLLHQGVHLIQRFVQDGRIRVHSPHENLQVKVVRALKGGHEFVCYLDALGSFDEMPCVIDWKTTASRYPDAPQGVLSLDPQLIAYSWATGVPEVGLVVFIRKRLSEIQYLRASISEQQRQDYGRLVEATVRQIDAGLFSSHSGIRFPQNPCLSCSHLGLCVDDKDLVEMKLIRKTGAAELDWLDELVD